MIKINFIKAKEGMSKFSYSEDKINTGKKYILLGSLVFLITSIVDAIFTGYNYRISFIGLYLVMGIGLLLDKD